MPIITEYFTTSKKRRKNENDIQEECIEMVNLNNKMINIQVQVEKELQCLR